MSRLLRVGTLVPVCVLAFASVAACASTNASMSASSTHRATPVTSAASAASASTVASAEAGAIATADPEPTPIRHPKLEKEGSEGGDGHAPPETKGTKAKSDSSACPGEMVLVEGDYCTDVRQVCVEWMDPPSMPTARCAKFGPSQCVGQHVHKRFCVDRDEYTEAGETLPKPDTSWTEAKQTCEGQKKRLCYETEWEFACEGEQMLPYSIGYERDSSKCNYDKMNLVNNQGKLNDYRKPSQEQTQCVSPFGVRNMTGNIDEWVFRDRTNGEWRSAMKGGWWMAARNRCRPATTAHDENYKGFQSGFRCCADPTE